MERATVRVTGVVQSVGFRPFVYRRAVANDLRGTVRNLGDAGVRIELEGGSEAIDAFLDALRTDAPPLARVDAVSVDREPIGAPAFDGFEIVASERGDGGGGTIPPDTATCERCLADMRTPESRYHGYWATSCVDCGPRFTVIESLPYDRPTTSMAAFPMCDDCREEYETPADRRYHAQTIACPQYGPTLRYGRLPDDASLAEFRAHGQPLEAEALIEAVRLHLDDAVTVHRGRTSLRDGVDGDGYRLGLGDVDTPDRPVDGLDEALQAAPGAADD
jgi:hydrogenase maturation protein HypF